MRTVRFLGVVGCVAAFLMAVSAQDRPAVPGQMQDLLFVSQHTPVSSIAEMLKGALKGVEGATVVAEPVSNSVFVHAPPDHVARIQGLLSGLDAPPPMIEFEVVIVRTTAAEGKRTAEAALAGNAQEVKASLADLEKAGAIEVLDRLHLTSLENQIAQVHFGQKVFSAVAVSDTPAPAGQPARRQASFAANEAGTKLTVTARRAGDDVVAELAVDKSWLPPAVASADGDATKPPATETLTARATLRLPQGQSVLLGGNETAAEGGRPHTAVIVTARVVAPGAKAARP